MSCEIITCAPWPAAKSRATVSATSASDGGQRPTPMSEWSNPKRSKTSADPAVGEATDVGLVVVRGREVAERDPLRREPLAEERGERVAPGPAPWDGDGR